MWFLNTDVHEKIINIKYRGGKNGIFFRYRRFERNKRD